MSSTTRILFATDHPAPARSTRTYVPRKLLTIDRASDPRLDPQALALSSLGWVLADDQRGQRLLALTGLGPADLRAGLHDPAVLGAVLDFLLGHEADLVLAAHELGVDPQVFAEARAELAR